MSKRLWSVFNRETGRRITMAAFPTEHMAKAFINILGKESDVSNLEVREL